MWDVLFAWFQLENDGRSYLNYTKKNTIKVNEKHKQSLHLQCASISDIQQTITVSSK